MHARVTLFAASHQAIQATHDANSNKKHLQIKQKSMSKIHAKSKLQPAASYRSHVGGRLRCRAGGAAVMLENTSASELKRGRTIFWLLPAWSSAKSRWANPSGCGSDAGQVVRLGFYAGQECGALGVEAVGQAMSCKNHAKTMQKPCKMRRVRSANPPNPHSPRVPCYMCYMCYMCYISQGNPLNIHSPRVPCYMCYMCYISQGNPPPRVPCYMCYMCYMALYSTYTTDFRAYRIYSTYSTCSKELGESGGSAAWRVRYSTYSTYSKDRGRVEVPRLGV